MLGHPFSHQEFILLDLEFTAWEGSAQRHWSAEQEQREIVAIGALKVSGSQPEFEPVCVTDSFSCLVKPSIQPQLSTYIQTLTAISQHQIEHAGLSFGGAFLQLLSFVGDLPIFAYGNDAWVLFENLWLNQIDAEVRTLNDETFSQWATVAGLPLKSLFYGDSGRSCLSTLDTDLKLKGVYEGRHFNMTCCNLRPWLQCALPETLGKPSGELGPLFKGFSYQGQAHDPLFDLHSLLFAIKQLACTDTRGK